MMALLIGSCADDSQSRIDELEARIAEYQQQELARSQTLSDFHQTLDQYGNIQDSLRMYENRIDSLKAEIKNKRKATKEDNAALNAMLAQIDNYLAQNKELAQTINAKDFKGKNEKQIVNLLLKSLDDKEKQISMMKSEIENLNNEVKGLKVENSNLTASLNKSREDLANMSDQNNKLTAAAKRLNLSNLQVKLPQGLIGGDKKAKKIDNLNFCYTINYNENAGDQSVTIYVRVTDSKGILLRSSDSNQFFSDEGQIGYTIKKTVNYTGKTIDDCISWNPGKGTLKSGDYIATYYLDARKVDQKTFSLK